MRAKDDKQKEIEAWALSVARKAGVPIPEGGFHDDSPDFRFISDGGALGIELSELIRPASSNNGILPVEEESVHREIIRRAQEQYYQWKDAVPVYVQVYFTNSKGKRLDKRGMTSALRSWFGRARVSHNLCCH